ncbi:hypothetical protein Q4506_07590 [Colwellia sp. 4_MG-2023]|uniref:protein YgfX n=1 Tax=unclassified Colwellia TaxID=196834 RepID=UPI0026E1B34B|nr:MULTISPECIES: protein YgfX [unclassified Colwellia]MDO6506714.1 hypothetical protein [Colwellia sp. 5_MG-2023]MDO6555540.1 hypothetical protein [Colwellia sp. 4_MG-2023]
MLYVGGFVAILLLPILLFTYAYHLALVVIVLTLFLFGFWLSSKSVQCVTDVNFELSKAGICSLKGNDYQLSKSSRFSFLGCWLILQPITKVSLMLDDDKVSKNKALFIYRDSLSEQDFSRLVTVITQLNRQP